MLSTAAGRRLVSGLVCRENGPVLSSRTTHEIVYIDIYQSLVKLESVPVEEKLAPGSVHVRMLLAPINPADLNQIEGSYAFIPPRPFPAGSEGLGEVVGVGPNVTGLRAGDWVVPAEAGLGTWREELVCQESALLSVPKDIPMAAAATILVNPCTAYRMLEDFVTLHPGDVIIQNGANSAVGRAVIQIAAMKGAKTINVVRDRPGWDALEQELRGLGATMVVRADRLPLPETREHIRAVTGAHPVLALNCVGGPAATDLARALAPGGTMVTYGGMSRKPVTIPTALLIFNDIRITGFWISAWYKRQLTEQGKKTLSLQREEMMETLYEMIRSGKLSTTPFRSHPLTSWRTAIESAMAPYTGKKEMFSFER